MLTDHTPIPALAVSDMDRARSFYEGTLGLSAGDPVPDGVLYRVGQGAILVYPSAFAGTNKATALTFMLGLDEFEQEKSRLRSAGITFDTFDWPGVSWDDGVASMDGGKALWFHDPDGNVLNIEAPGS